jgi:hypothetical protein
VTKLPGEDSIAEKLGLTRWDYTQGDDRSFLLDPIGKFFSTFRWDGTQDTAVVICRSPTYEGEAD